MQGWFVEHYRPDSVEADEVVHFACYDEVLSYAWEYDEGQRPGYLRIHIPAGATFDQREALAKLGELA